MILGEYPCCDGPLDLAMSDRTPAWFSEECPHCGAKVWHRLTRIPGMCMSWTEDSFLAEHEIDAMTKTIIAKPGTEAAEFDRLNSGGF